MPTGPVTIGRCQAGEAQVVAAEAASSSLSVESEPPKST
jgi:hypothetical protein